MKKIDIDNWDRKVQYLWFSSFSDSTFSMDVRMDVTETLKWAKERDLSSFAIILYLVTTSLNRLPAFRRRILGGEVVEIDSARAGYTIKVGERGFSTARADVSHGFDLFMEDIKRNRKYFTEEGHMESDYNQGHSVEEFYCTCIPWVDVLGVKHPIPDQDKESQSVPRPCWGAYAPENGRVRMTLNLTASHALMDGRDMAEAFIEIQKAFNDPDKYTRSNL